MPFRTTPVLALLVLLIGPAAARAAEPASISFGDVLAAASRGGFSVPAAWAGVWDITDTTRDCTGVITDTDASPDTLCTGDDVTPDSEGFPVQLDCTGSVDDTTVDITCTGTFSFPPCTADFSIELDGIRTGDTYVATSAFSVDYSGPGACSLTPDICEITTTHGTRTGPEPAECAMPVEASSWGQVKSYYR